MTNGCMMGPGGAPKREGAGGCALEGGGWGVRPRGGARGDACTLEGGDRGVTRP